MTTAYYSRNHSPLRTTASGNYYRASPAKPVPYDRRDKKDLYEGLNS